MLKIIIGLIIIVIAVIKLLDVFRVNINYKSKLLKIEIATYLEDEYNTI